MSLPKFYKKSHLYADLQTYASKCSKDFRIPAFYRVCLFIFSDWHKQIEVCTVQKRQNVLVTNVP